MKRIEISRLVAKIKIKVIKMENHLLKGAALSVSISKIKTVELSK